MTRNIWTNFRSPILRSLHMKFEFNWPSGFRGEDVWKCWRTDGRRTTDDGRRSHWYTNSSPRSLRLRWAKKTPPAKMLRTSDGGNGNHSVSLPIILIKIKVNQMLPSSYISSLLVSILWFCIWFPISINVRLYFGAKMVTFCIKHIGNRKIFLKHHSPPSPN